MPTAGPGEPAGERLQKVLARAGVGSRRACEELIADGRASIDGVVARLGQRVDLQVNRVEVDGIPLPGRQDIAYYLLNKPVGVVSTASDPEGRPTVVELVPAEPRVFPVGRLDAASSGLLVLTNDGDLAYQLTHPSFGVEKEYVVEVEGTLSRDMIGRLRRGVMLDDGMTAPARVRPLGPNVAQVVIHEGRNRQLRRMCEAVGHPVRSLTRTRIGPISDKQLQRGQARVLGPSEVMALWAAATGRPAGNARGTSGRS